MAAIDQTGMEVYDLARKRVKGDAAAASQQTSDALARRFASLGNLNSGARIKTEQVAQDQAQGQLNNALEGVDAAQQQEVARRQQVQQAQEYNTSERLGSQQFATGERLGSQDFAAAQAQIGRDFTSGEREAIQKYQTGERLSSQDFANLQGIQERAFAQMQQQEGISAQSKQANEDRQLAYQQLYTASEEFNKTFKEEVRVNNANIAFGNQVLSQKGFLDNLTSGIPILNSAINIGVKGAGGSFVGGPIGQAAGIGKGVRDEWTTIFG